MDRCSYCHRDDGIHNLWCRKPAVVDKSRGLPLDETQLEWTITLSRYQRDNLLAMFNALGYPYHGPNDCSPMNTGDWFGEVPLMLAFPGRDCVIGPGDRPNCSVSDMRQNLIAWRHPEEKGREVIRFVMDALDQNEADGTELDIDELRALTQRLGLR